MRYRKLANTDVTLSEVGFGVWTVSAGWWGEFSDDQAADLLRRALDLGVTFFDTGDTYGNGRGETILAKAFKGRRDQIVIGTKFGYDFYTNPDLNRGQRERPHDWSPKFVRFALEQSLKRLETDYIDLWMLHNPRMDAIQKDDLFALLEQLKAEGKIRAYGASLGPAIGGTEHGDEALEDPQAGRPPDHLQPAGAGPRPALLAARARAKCRDPGPGAALVGHARGEVHPGDDVPAERPPQPPPALLADRGAPEDRDRSSSSTRSAG